MKRRRVIDRLRDKLPGRWRYDHRAGHWKRHDGVVVEARAGLVLGIDGPRDDVFTTVYYRTDTNEQVNELRNICFPAVMGAPYGTSKKGV